MNKRLPLIVLPMLIATVVAIAANAPAHAAASTKTLEGVTAVSAGEFHTCAVAKRRAYCWGSHSGDIGDIVAHGSKRPIRVRGAGSNVIGIAAAGSEACASTRSTVKCWGEINGDASVAAGPRLVRGVEAPVTAISLGDGSYSTRPTELCVAFRATLGCKSLAPENGLREVAQLGGAPSSIGAGLPNCAVVAGAAKCWGEDYEGKLGNGALGSGLNPTTVSGLGENVTAIANGKRAVCAIVSSAVKCWGSMLGPEGGPDIRSDLPSDVPTLSSGVTAIAAGDDYACAIVDGGVKCWGRYIPGYSNSGAWSGSAVPLPVVGLSQGVTAIAAGAHHACAIASGTLKCWGSNGEGQLGNGRVVASAVPEIVAAPVRAIRVRGHHQSTPTLDTSYTDYGVAVTVHFPFVANVWAKDVCVGRVAISISGGGKKKESARTRVRMRDSTCQASWNFGPRSKRHQDVTVRVRTNGNTAVKPARLKTTARYFTCWSSDCP